MPPPACRPSHRHPRAAALLGAHRATLKPFALSFARYEMLRLLGFTREGRMPMASAIARLQVHPTSVTNTVDRLVRDGLVGASRTPGDGRAAISADDSGVSSSSARPRHSNTEVFAEPGLSDDDIASSCGSCATVRKGHAGDFTDPRPLPDPL